MKKQKQLSLLKPQAKFFGGALLHGKRKALRPLSSKDSIHFVLRSQWAYGKDSFLAKQNYNAIQKILKRFALQFGVRIYQQSTNSNHIHLLLRITNRQLYRAFIKAITGKIASHVIKQRCKASGCRAPEQSFKRFLEAKRMSEAGDGCRATKKQRFWQYRPFSRLVNWGKDFKISLQYLKQNTLEAVGFVAYKPRKQYYANWLNENYSSGTG